MTVLGRIWWNYLLTGYWILGFRVNFHSRGYRYLGQSKMCLVLIMKKYLVILLEGEIFHWEYPTHFSRDFCMHNSVLQRRHFLKPVFEYR